MARPHIRDGARPATVIPAAPRRHYLVLRREDVWFIAFDGKEFGPYQSEREAMLFAVDAAHKLGEQGEETRVLLRGEDGEASPVWTYGLDPYPPSQ